ncbi:MAG TPA: chorismate mutase [Cyanobacteria bacterium UBA11369]|nr:chorismate mutase [Cyanobacteria bacterium UBA11371]HBE36216.1 chorismate mutase [Cyanobacteria bacterium UBA11368]HBE50926.1 chorismate mutase [Cyanobacteria bacterium UBA11369]
MAYSPELIALAGYMAGEFDNRDQAIADPAWYVHVRLWQRPVALFAEDSLTLFAEQANALYLDRPYRQRIIRLQQGQVQYYMLKDPSSIQGAGINPERLKTLTLDDIEYLPGCTLTVTQDERLRFQATLPPNCRCCFTFRGETYQVSLGFEASLEQFLSYDKGIDPVTGKAIWGALLGPYRFTKRQDFSAFLPI